jgi:MoaA/NifB/PqqE/SkfB family radical SAM enzyme
MSRKPSEARFAGSAKVAQQSVANTWESVLSQLKQAKKDADFALGILRKRPFQVLVQVTNRCNMKCSFCDFWPNGVPREQELSTDDYRKLADDLAELGCCIISIEGGEPFIRPDLVDIVRAFGKHHIPVLYTNGWSVTSDNARELFDAGLVHACVSIDYPDAERHDKKRVLDGAFDRAWRALDAFRDASSRKDKQVHVMTVLMEDNWRDFGKLLAMSKKHGVGHQVTLLSKIGYRRGKSLVDSMPAREMPAHMLDLWDRHEHLHFFRDYFEEMKAFLSGGELPRCRAGLQSFNVDHVGNVSPCIEKIDSIVGNVREVPLKELHRRMTVDRAEIDACQQCWTACRGFNQAMGNGGSPRAWLDLSTRMRSS